MDTVNPDLEAWRKQEEERRVEQLKRDIAALMASESGRRLAWWILESTHIFQSTFRDNPQAAAFAEGKRAFGLMFLEQISTTATNDYLLMQQEALNERTERNLRRQHAINGS